MPFVRHNFDKVILAIIVLSLLPPVIEALRARYRAAAVRERFPAATRPLPYGRGSKRRRGSLGLRLRAPLPIQYGMIWLDGVQARARPPTPMRRFTGNSMNRLPQRFAPESLTRGERLPATRELAGLLGLNRTTVSAAYEMLETEGLIAGQVGRGSFVTGGGGPPAAASIGAALLERGDPGALRSRRRVRPRT